ncbi:hypothetical protein NN561_013658 [Cricetulus griseus]
MKGGLKPVPVAGRERPLLPRGAGQEALTASAWLCALSTCMRRGLAKSRRWRNGGVREGAAVAAAERAPLSARPPPRRTAGRDPRLSDPLRLYSRDGGRAQGLEKRDRKPRRPRSPACWLFLFVVAAPTQLS